MKELGELSMDEAFTSTVKTKDVVVPAFMKAPLGQSEMKHFSLNEQAWYVVFSTPCLNWK